MADKSPSDKVSARPWIGALGVTLLMQAVASFMAQGLPVLAPLITQNAGMRPESIGHLSLVAGLGTPAALVLASLLPGIGYGPSPPAGSRILAATAPPRHRSLIFSIKQAAATAGSTLFTFLAYLLAPAAFALPVTLSGSWSLAFTLAAVQLGAVALLVALALRRAEAKETR